MIERYFKCGKPTGRAGIGEDLIYDGDGSGPYCEECYQDEVYEVMKNYESDIRQVTSKLPAS